MATQLIEPLEVENPIDEGLGSTTQLSKVKTAVSKIVRAMAAYASGRRGRPSGNFMPRKSYEDARLEFNRLLYW